MKPRQWIAASCALVGFSNLSGQTSVTVTGSVGSNGVTGGSINIVTPAVSVSVSGSVGAGSTTGAVTITPAIVTTPETPKTPVLPSVVPTNTATPSDARITNLSTRARVGIDGPLVTGFAISGDGSRTILVRAVGPTLGVFGVADTLTAPHLQLHDARGAVLLENAGWSGAVMVTTATAQAGAFPLPAGSADSALVATLAAGTYSVEVTDDAGRGGVVLTEIYDVEKTATGSHLTNVSTRDTVAPGGGEFISGFTVSGTQPRDFLVRGVGPALTKFNVSGVLRDPALTVFNLSGTPIATNDNWSGLSAAQASPVVPVSVPQSGSSSSSSTGSVNAVPVSIAQQTATSAAQAAAAAVAAATSNSVATATARAGAFSLDAGSADAALVITLNPGAYTVQVNGTNGTSGVALLEIYELP